MKTLKKKITHNDEFNGLPVLKQKEGLLVDYLQRIYDTLDLALDDHPRTMAVRVDLRLPLLMVMDNSNLMKNFISSLDAQIQADLRRKERAGKTKRKCRLRYVWVREKDKALHHHYHLVILLNKDVYNCLGSFARSNNLSHKIKTAGCRAVGIKLEDGARLVHFPENCVDH
ncbi:inovirus Gp2 family protein [Vibrio parahaemolyticus]|nr:inovirus Gp2 family protein [Vibrio parahaemolyticus]